MTSDFVKVVDTLTKEKPDMYFTKDCQPLPEWCPDHVNTFHSPDGVPYGYYEIKESSIGPIMLHISRRSPYSYEVEVEIKVADCGGCFYENDFGPGSGRGHGICSAVYDLIEKSNRIPSNMSAEEVIEKWKRFCNNPKARTEDKKNASNKNRTARDSFSELCRILNKPRPYRSSDFKRQHFIPDLVIALLMVANFAGAPAKINTPAPRAKQVASATNQQSQANYTNYLTALQKTKGC